MVKARNPAFGSVLRSYRRNAGRTQEELAARSGLSVRGISDLERGLIRRPRGDTIRLLAEALRLAPSDRSRLQTAAGRRAPLPVESREDVPGTRPPEKPRTAWPRALPNLPVELTSFVGRETDIADLGARLRDPSGPHLMTLTGAGGCGKTRLASRVAALVGETYPEGVWFVDLAPVVEPSLVPSSVANSLGVADPADRSAVENLASVLRAQRLLLVLDNCEHLLDAVARLVATLLHACPDLRIVATSREPLRVFGEAAWRVPSLTVPPVSPVPNVSVEGFPSPRTPEPPFSIVDVGGTEAVRLFLDRARTAWPDFALTGENAWAVAEICRRLDGIPLAIELAAARLRFLDIYQIAARLDERFQLLTIGERTAPRRHQTLHALIDWSYDLLTPDERLALSRLAVFSGTWPIEAAEFICGNVGTEAGVLGGALDVIGRLVDKSLVVVEQGDGTRRYRLLETIRQFAQERLGASGERRTVCERHRDWYLQLSDTAFRELNGRRHGAWMKRLADEHDNLRVALAACRLDPRGFELGLRLIANLGWYFISSNRFGEGGQWLDEFLARSISRDAMRLRGLAAITSLRLHRGDVSEARRHAEEHLELARALGHESDVSQGQARLALVEASDEDYPRALARLEGCLAIARARGDLASIRELTCDLGLVCIAAGEDARAREHLEESLRLARQIGIMGFAAMALLRLSVLDRLTGEFARARARIEECQAIFKDGRVTEEHTQIGLANLARVQGDFREARRLLTGALVRSARRGDQSLVAEKLCWIGVLDVAEGDSERGVRRIAAATAEHPFLAAIHVPDIRREVAAALDRARAILGGNAFERAWSEGVVTSRDDAITDALGAERET